MLDELECDVYRSAKKENLYLYIPKGADFAQVPEALMQQFGDAEKVLTFSLTADRTLAKEDPKTVLENVKNQGYHLQLPPADERFHG